MQRFGVRLTSSAQTIVDAAEAGTDPSVIVEAVDRVLEEGFLTADELRRTAEDRSALVLPSVRVIAIASRGDI